MEEELKDDLSAGADNTGSGRKKKKTTRIIFITAACVIVAAAAFFIYFHFKTGETGQHIIDQGTALKGVSVGGIEISGMTKDQVLAATAGLEGDLLGKAKFTLDVNGTKHEYSAYDFCLQTDYQDVIVKALEYGHSGSFEQRTEAGNTAMGKGINFPVTLSVDEDKLKAKLAKIKTDFDVAPQDASATFTPWGHTADGKAFAPDITEKKAICSSQASGKIYANTPELVKLADSDMPNKLRYAYYENSKYVSDYTPPGASISRFNYTDGVTGVSAKTDEILDDIVNEVKAGDYSTITVPCDVVKPTNSIDDIKANTQLISSFTSSFSKHSHYNARRNYNVSMMSSLINGSVIKPGETWSANDTAGLRDAQTAKVYGWKKAGGIMDGGFTSQYGGGVCQLGSTTYNAALRSGSGLEVVEFNHHSIPSDYIPIGLDATLNSVPNLDLKLKNDNATWDYYIVSYVNVKDKDVTVEIYGPPLVDAKYGNVIYDYRSKSAGSYGSARSKVYKSSSAQTAPDNTVIDASNPKYDYSPARGGRTAKVWRYIYSLDGKLLDTIELPLEKYPPVLGRTFIYTGPLPSKTTTTSPS